MTHSRIIPTLSSEPSAIAADLSALNAELLAEHARRPDPWSVEVAVARQARVEGKGMFPAASPDAEARTRTVRAADGTQVPIRVILPKSRATTGTYLHFHGGGWLFGQAVENDPRLRALAETTGLATVSVDYRLAPENPFPAAFEDCVAVARALVAGELDLNTGFLAIGGESAGAHLSVVTLLRLRDEDGHQPFAAANLVAGFYDLSLTPSASRQSDPRIIINSHDLGRFVALSVPENVSRRDPSVSPLYADLHDMPIARFSCGSVDILRDDTVFMANRWAMAGNETHLAITPGGCHVFEAFGTASGQASLTAANAFLSDVISSRAEAARSASLSSTGRQS